jgi:tetratricopeptide (TPR) repeat protein
VPPRAADDAHALVPSGRPLALGALCGLALLPWEPHASALAVKTTALVVLAGALMIRRFVAPENAAVARRGGDRVPRGAFLGLVVWATLSLAWGSKVGVHTSALWFAAWVIAGELGARALPAASLTVVLGSTLIASAEALAGQRIHGGHGNANVLGLTLAIGAAPALCAAASWLTRQPPGRLGLRVARVGLTSTVAAGALWAAWRAESRTGFVALLVAAAVALGGPRLPRAASALVVVGALVASAVLAALPAQRAPAGLGLLDSAAHALEGRAWIAGTNARAAFEELPAGAGLGDYPRAFLAAQGERLSARSPDAAANQFVYAETAHSSFWHVTVELGPLALALLAAALALALREALARGDRGAAGVLAAVAVASIADDPLLAPAPCALFVLALAGGVAQPSAAPRSARVGPRPRWADVTESRAFRALAFAVLALCLRATLGRWLAERTSDLARTSAPETRRAALKRATTLDPLSPSRSLEYGLALNAGGRLAEADAEYTRAATLGDSLALRVARGNLAAERGLTEEAERELTGALRLHPGHFRARANLAWLYTRAGRLAEAEREARVARDLLPHHPDLERLTRGLAELRREAATRR